MIKYIPRNVTIQIVKHLVFSNQYSDCIAYKNSFVKNHNLAPQTISNFYGCHGMTCTTCVLGVEYKDEWEDIDNIELKKNVE